MPMTGKPPFQTTLDDRRVLTEFMATASISLRQENPFEVTWSVEQMQAIVDAVSHLLEDTA
jgi:hypothetical protein